MTSLFDRLQQLTSLIWGKGNWVKNYSYLFYRKVNIFVGFNVGLKYSYSTKNNVCRENSSKAYKTVDFLFFHKKPLLSRG